MIGLIRYYNDDKFIFKNLYICLKDIDVFMYSLY